MKHLPLSLLVAFMILTGCHKSASVIKPKPFTILGSPSEIYDSARPKIQKIISPQTEIVRIDNADGIDLRFSMQNASDDSIRLIEVKISKSNEGKASISIASSKFSFIPSGEHDISDYNLEALVAKILKGESQ